MVSPEPELPAHVALFSESASRAVVTPHPGQEAELERLADRRGVPLTRLGLTGGSKLRFESMFDVSLADALIVYEGAIPTLMAARSSA